MDWPEGWLSVCVGSLRTQQRAKQVDAKFFPRVLGALVLLGFLVEVPLVEMWVGLASCWWGVGSAWLMP